MRRSQSGEATAISRRTLLGAASVAPVVGSATSAPLLANDMVARCAEWLALDLEIDRLTLRWSQLEALMVREHHWFGLTNVERRALTEAAEMYEIDDTLEALFRQRERMLEPLSSLKADTLHGVASKLAVAARLLQYEEHPAQALVASALRELAGMCRPDCGAPHVAGAERP